MVIFGSPDIASIKGTGDPKKNIELFISISQNVNNNPQNPILVLH